MKRWLPLIVLAVAAGALAAVKGLEGPVRSGDPAPVITFHPSPAAITPQPGDEAAELGTAGDKASTGEAASGAPEAKTPETQEWYSGRSAARPATPSEATAPNGGSEPALALQWDPEAAGLGFTGEGVRDALAPQAMLPDDGALPDGLPAETGDDGEEAADTPPWSGLTGGTPGLPGGGLIGAGPAPALPGGTAGGIGNLGIGN